MSIEELRQLKSNLCHDYTLCRTRTLKPTRFLHTLETKAPIVFRVARRNIETYRFYDDPNFLVLQKALDEAELIYNQVLRGTKKKVMKQLKAPSVTCNHSSFEGFSSSNVLIVDLTCGLPNEIWAKIFHYLYTKDRSKLASCNPHLRQVADIPYTYRWQNLKKLQWTAPVMEELEKQWPKANCFFLLLLLKQHFFFQFGIFPPMRLPQTENDYINWHQHAKNENNRALFKLFGDVLNIYQVDAIREGLKDPEQVKLLERVTELDLSDSRLKILPSEIVRFTNLKTLNLRNNRLMTVPMEIGLLSHLECLDLQSNDLFYIPPEVGSLTQLQRLYLNNNLLRFIPQEILSLPYLEVNTSGNPWLRLTSSPRQTHP